MRDKPYCNAPWLGLAYESTQGCQPCCEWKQDTFWGTYEEYIKSELDGGLFAEFYVIENFAKSAFLLYMAFYLGIAVLFLSFMLI